jgi:hypothetical protein
MGITHFGDIFQREYPNEKTDLFGALIIPLWENFGGVLLRMLKQRSHFSRSRFNALI